METKIATWKISPKNRQWWLDRNTTNQWLNSSSLKGKKEGFILAAQQQSLGTRIYQGKILKNGADLRWWPYAHSKETIDHVIQAWPTIVSTEYFQEHDRVTKTYTLDTI